MCSKCVAPEAAVVRRQAQASVERAARQGDRALFGLIIACTLVLVAVRWWLRAWLP